MNATCLRAISYARDDGEFQRARDVLYDFVPRTLLEEQEKDYAERRVQHFEDLRERALCASQETFLKCVGRKP